MSSDLISPRRILALAVPALGALAADPLLSLVDTAFVGRIGPVELAALGVDAAIFSFAFAIFNFLAYATTPLVAQAAGRGDDAEAGRVVQRALTLAVLIGAAALVILVAGATLFVKVMQAGPEVVDPAVAYLRLRAFAVPALLIITAGHGAYRGFQDTRTPLYITLAVNGLNAVLDPLFIFGAGWGLEGAAIATVVAQWIGAAIFLLLLRRRGLREGWPGTVPRLVELRPFLAIGGVLIFRTLMLVSALAAATAAAARTGTIEVAAHQIVLQLWFLLAMIIDALAIAAQAMVGDLVGRDRPATARALSDRLLRWGLATGVGLGVAFIAIRPWVGGWFSTDGMVVDAVDIAVPIAALMQPVAALVFVLDGVFLGVLAIRLLAGSTTVGFLAMLGGLVLTLDRGWGLAGVWWSVTAMVVARGLVLGWAYRGWPTVSRA